MQVLWGYDAIYPVRERWHYVISLPDCFSTYTQCENGGITLLVYPTVSVLVSTFIGQHLREWSLSNPILRSLFMICLRVLTSTRCQYLQVLWGYGAKHPVREWRHYVVSVPYCFSTCEYLHRTASTRVVFVQPNPETLVHDYVGNKSLARYCPLDSMQRLHCNREATVAIKLLCEKLTRSDRSRWFFFGA